MHPSSLSPVPLQAGLGLRRGLLPELLAWNLAPWTFSNAHLKTGLP